MTFKIMQFSLLIFVLSIFCASKVICNITDQIKSNGTYSLEAVISIRGLSEGPHWDIRSQKLYFVQIWSQRIYSYNPITGEFFYAFIKNGPVTAVVTLDDNPGKLLATSGNDIVLITWNGESNTTNPEFRVITSFERSKRGFRFNDGKVDAAGRLWIGTMCQINHKNIPKAASLYLIDEEMRSQTKLFPISISNGLDWSRDNKVFYYIDTPTDQVVAFDFDLASGNISNMRLLIDFKEKGFDGHPDGMTIDTDGNLWIALVHGYKLVQVNSKNGEIMRTIDFPTRMVTSVAFGGPNLDIIYVTTGNCDFPDKPLDDLGGTVFALKNLGVKGYPPNSFKLSYSKL